MGFVFQLEEQTKIGEHAGVQLSYSPDRFRIVISRCTTWDDLQNPFGVEMRRRSPPFRLRERGRKGDGDRGGGRGGAAEFKHERKLQDGNNSEDWPECSNGCFPQSRPLESETFKGITFCRLRCFLYQTASDWTSKSRFEKKGLKVNLRYKCP